MLSTSFKVACHTVLKKFLETVKGKARLGIQAYADGLMIIPKTLAANAGYDSQEVMVKLLEEARVPRALLVAPLPRLAKEKVQFGYLIYGKFTLSFCFAKFYLPDLMHFSFTSRTRPF